MTALETWITTTAAQLVHEDPTLPTTPEQRIAIGLVQARAKECRAIANEMLVNGGTRNPVLYSVYAALIDRSSKLEKLGLDMVTEYPPNTVAEERKLVVMP